MSQYVKNEQKGILKKKTKQTKDEPRWVDFKTASNEVNNSIQFVKCKFLSDNLAAIQKRYPNNELSSCQHMKKVIADKFNSSMPEMVEAFTLPFRKHWSGIGKRNASC